MQVNILRGLRDPSTYFEVSGMGRRRRLSTERLKTEEPGWGPQCALQVRNWPCRAGFWVWSKERM